MVVAKLYGVYLSTAINLYFTYSSSKVDQGRPTREVCVVGYEKSTMYISIQFGTLS